MFLETSVLYAYQNTSFISSTEQLRSFLSYGGGILEYAGLFFTDMLKFNGAGAMLFSIFTIAAVFLYKRYLVKINLNENLLLLSALIPFIFLATLTYNFNHPIAINLKLLTGLLSLNILISLPNRKITDRIILFIILIATWYICGLPFFIIVLSCFAIYTITNKTFKYNLIVFLLSATTIYLLNLLVFYRPVEITFQEIIDYQSQIPYLLLYTYLLFIFIPLATFLKYKISVNSIIQFLVILIIGFLLGYKSYNEENHIIGRIMFAGNENDINEVLTIRKNTHVNSRIVSNYTNVALLKKGLLLDQMFSYNQGFGKFGVFPSIEFDYYNAFSNMKLCFDLGLINQSIRWASESAVKFGYNFEILKYLVLNYMVIDNRKAADKYYSILNKTLFNKEEKRKIRRLFEGYINNEPGQLILEKRKLIPENDFFLSPNETEKHNFASVIKENKNLKVLELYIALCLTDNELESVKDVIRHFKELGYKKLPIHIQEALCLIYPENPEIAGLYGFEIDKNIREESIMFVRTMRKYDNNIQAARDAAKSELSRNYGSTYWYYLTYISPKTLSGL